MSVYLSIGSNLGNRKENIRKALNAVLNISESIRCSSPIRTKAYGLTGQPDFINMCVEIKTKLEPEELLKALLQIETALGRKRTLHWGPRIIDLDIVFYNHLIIKKPDLTIPHPDMQNRYFVLKPLSELCPDFIHPILKKSVMELLNGNLLH